MTTPEIVVHVGPSYRTIQEAIQEYFPHVCSGVDVAGRTRGWDHLNCAVCCWVVRKVEKGKGRLDPMS